MRRIILLGAIFLGTTARAGAVPGAAGPSKPVAVPPIVIANPHHLTLREARRALRYFWPHRGFPIRIGACQRVSARRVVCADSIEVRVATGTAATYLWAPGRDAVALGARGAVSVTSDSRVVSFQMS
jgi:hypothetical protein